ncbi:hypothetical protein SNEBB_004063 [Seison nebaliae]|nr:hypothetical protein SNEBB_004063 [Seison nebaliae]
MVHLRAKLVIAGDGAVGKTTLRRMITSDGADLVKAYKPTIMTELSQKKMRLSRSEDAVEFHIYDSSGLAIFTKFNQLVWHNPDIYFLVYDVTMKNSLRHCGYWMQRLLESCKDRDAVGFLIANKIDQEQKREITYNVGDNLAKKHNLIYKEICCFDISTINDLLSEAADNSFLVDYRYWTMTDENKRILINIDSIKNLYIQKTEGITLVLKLEWNDKIIGETQKVMCNPSVDEQYDQLLYEEKPINQEFFLNIQINDLSFFNDIASKPLIMTIYEIIPKEKKQKEDKSTPIGQMIISLLPFIMGQNRLDILQPIIPIGSNPILQNTPDNEPAAMSLVLESFQDIAVRSFPTSTKLTPQQQLSPFINGNLMKVFVDSLNNLPEQTGPNGVFTLFTKFPLGKDKWSLNIITNGVLRSFVDSQTDPKEFRYDNTRTILEKSGYYITGAIPPPPTIVTSPTVKKVAGNESPMPEEDSLRVSWRVLKNVFVDKLGMSRLKQFLQVNRYWPFEVIKTFPTTNNRLRKDEDVIMHSVIKVDMAQLIYPGSTVLQGAYPLKTPSGKLDEKTLAPTGSSLNEVLGLLPSLFDRSIISTGFGSKNQPSQAKEKLPPKKLKTGEARLTTTGDKTAQQSGTEQEQNDYEESGCVIQLTIAILFPIVEERTTVDYVKKIAEMIPPRPKIPLAVADGKRAVDEFHEQIRSILGTLVAQYKSLFAEQNKLSTEYSEIMQRKEKLLFELNTNGRYFAFKEQLKLTIIRIVREKYGNTKKFANDDELHRFIVDLYIFLIDEMQSALNNELTDEEKRKTNHLDIQRLLLFAKEAEWSKDYKLAHYYYKERILHDETNPDLWVDYARMALDINDYSMAEQCFREAISLDQTHIVALTLLGVVLMTRHRVEEAQTCLERAVSLDPESPVIICLLSLFFEHVNDVVMAEMTVKKSRKIAKKLYRKEVVEANKESQEVQSLQNLTVTPGSRPDSGKISPNQRAKSSKLDRKNRPISRSKKRLDKTDNRHISPDEKEMEVKMENQIEVEAVNIMYKKTAQFLIKNQLTILMERALAHRLVPMNQDGDEEIFKDQPFPKKRTREYAIEYWLIVTQAKLLKREWQEAMESANKILNLDYTNPDAWAYLGHAHFGLNEIDEAQSCYVRVLKFNKDATDDHFLRIRLGNILLQKQQYEEAKETFLACCFKEPTCSTWLGVGIACYRLECLTDAEDALSEANVLNNREPTVWSYLSMICLRQNRIEEAQQAFKYCTDIQEDNPEIWEEIVELQDTLGLEKKF